VALHELAHVKWSPKRLPKVPFDPRYLMAVEDARINLGLLWIELPLLRTEHDPVRRRARASGPRGTRSARLVLRAVAAQGTNAEEAVLGELAGQPRAVRDLAYRHVRRVRIALLRARRQRRAPVASFRVARRLAAELARELEPELERLGFPKGLPFPLQLAGAGCCLGHGHGGPHALGRPGRGKGEETPKDCPSGELSVVVAPLPHATPLPRGPRRGSAHATSEGRTSATCTAGRSTA
jgi:hypothetical protein